MSSTRKAFSVGMGDGAEPPRTTAVATDADIIEVDEGWLEEGPSAVTVQMPAGRRARVTLRPERDVVAPPMATLTAPTSATLPSTAAAPWAISSTDAGTTALATDADRESVIEVDEGWLEEGPSAVTVRLPSTAAAAPTRPTLPSPGLFRSLALAKKLAEPARPSKRALARPSRFPRTLPPPLPRLARPPRFPRTLPPPPSRLAQHGPPPLPARAPAAPASPTRAAPAPTLVRALPAAVGSANGSCPAVRETHGEVARAGARPPSR